MKTKVVERLIEIDIGRIQFRVWCDEEKFPTHQIVIASIKKAKESHRNYCRVARQIAADKWVNAVQVRWIIDLQSGCFESLIIYNDWP